jgi:hypothetical protein
MTPFKDRQGPPLFRLQSHWEDRALYHPDEEERLISEDEAWRLSRWRDAMNRFHAKHVRKG